MMPRPSHRTQGPGLTHGVRDLADAQRPANPAGNQPPPPDLPGTRHHHDRYGGDLRAVRSGTGVGRGVALSPGLREKLEIVTKAGIYVPCKYHPDRHTAFYDASGPRMVKSLEKSLRFLGTDRVELLLVHRPDWLTPAADTAGGLNQLLRQGKIRAAGVSNYTGGTIRPLEQPHGTAAGDQPDRVPPLHMDPIDDGTLTQCEKAGVLPMAWSPLAGGRLLIRPTKPPSGLPRRSRRWPHVRLGQASSSWPTPGSWPTPAGRCRSSAEPRRTHTLGGGRSGNRA